jgi:hypothetical protein
MSSQRIAGNHRNLGNQAENRAACIPRSTADSQ